MDLTMKTIFYSYPEYEEIISSMQKLIKYKAISSHCNAYKTEVQVEKIVKLISTVDLIKQLKIMVEEIMEKLSPNEQELVKIRYFKKAKGGVFEYRNRTYYRKQLRLEKKLEILLGEYGIDGVWFDKNCKDVHFLCERYNALLRQKEQRRAKLDSINQACERLNQKLAA